MLFYSSIHPEWDCFGAFSAEKKAQNIAALLEAIALNHPRNTGACFDTLERLGIVLGCGGFETILIQREPFGDVHVTDNSWARTVLSFAKTILTTPIWYCFSVSSRVYILSCFPRMVENVDRKKSVEAGLYDSWQKLLSALQPAYPGIRIISSDLQFGETGIFRTFNNLHHAMEYFDFLDKAPALIQLNAEEQLHGAFIEDLSVYRQFSVAMAERLSREDCIPSELARDICDRILSGSVPSIESVHHHIQIFMLTFTDYLGSSGLVDTAYMTRNSIVYRSMGFERESEFRRIMEDLVTELWQQNHTLRAIGKQKRTQSIREYIESNISDPNLTVSVISDTFKLSTTQLSKQFKYYYGVSLYRFLQQTRFQLAQNLLKEHQDWSMQEVAATAGYSDLSTMYRAFHQFGNVTPAALRDALQKNQENAH